MPHQVLLHRRERPSRGERENSLRDLVAEFFVMGNDASPAVQVDQVLQLKPWGAVPTHWLVVTAWGWAKR